MDCTVRVWDVRSGREIRRLECFDHTGAVALNADGNTLFAACHYDIFAWDWVNGGEPRQLKGHSGYVRALLLSRDGSTLFSGSDDATIRAWDVQSGTCVSTAYADAPISSLALAFDGYVAVGDQSGRVSLFKYRGNPQNAGTAYPVGAL
jgi:WD40 repeat protein